LRNYARTLEIANKKVSEVVELGWHIGVLRAVTHVTQGLDVEQSQIELNFQAEQVHLPGPTY